MFQITEILSTQRLDVNANTADVEKGDQEKLVLDKHESSEMFREVSPEKPSEGSSPCVIKGSYFDKVAQRKKNWEYFEINHPKAISDQRLQQLKAKYQKKREDAEAEAKIETVVENDEEAAEARDKVEAGQMRSFRLRKIIDTVLFQKLNPPF